MDFACWKCGSVQVDEPMPLGREARCQACDSDLHVCRQCRFHDTSKAKSCAEPVADEVRDKERSNFCGYFALNTSAYGGSAEADSAKRQLESLFGLSGDGATPPSPADAKVLEQGKREAADKAQAELAKLFGLDDK